MDSGAEKRGHCGSNALIAWNPRALLVYNEGNQSRTKEKQT